jgi:hypothetical protein
MTPQQECLFDVSWQVRRLRYINGFKTEEETRRHISDMLTYISKASTPYWKFIRVWRCRNVVTYALRYAEKHDNLVGIKLLKQLSKGLEIEYNRYKDAHHKGPLFKTWDWFKVREDLRKLIEVDGEMFRTLLHYTYSRLQGPGKEVPTEMLARPELARFYRTMRDVEFDHAN